MDTVWVLLYCPHSHRVKEDGDSILSGMPPADTHGQRMSFSDIRNEDGDSILSGIPRTDTHGQRMTTRRVGAVQTHYMNLVYKSL